MNDYVDQLIAGLQPKAGPDLIPANDDSRLEVVTSEAPSVDGVPCTEEERRFYEQANSVVERECREGLVGDGPAVDERTRLQRAERQAIGSLQRGVQALDFNALMLAVSLREYQPGALGLHEVSVCDPLGSAFASCTQVMEQIARLTGRRMPSIPLLVSLEPIEPPTSSLRDQLRASVEQVRQE